MQSVRYNKTFKKPEVNYKSPHAWMITIIKYALLDFNFFDNSSFDGEVNTPTHGS